VTGELLVLLGSRSVESVSFWAVTAVRDGIDSSRVRGDEPLSTRRCLTTIDCLQRSRSSSHCFVDCSSLRIGIAVGLSVRFLYSLTNLLINSD